MKKINLILISILLFSVSNAQISGYMGKKFSILYSASVGVPHFSNYNSRLDVLPILNHTLGAEYVIGNSVAFGAAYKLGMSSDFNRLEFYAYEDFTERFKFYSHTYKWYFKFYRKNSLAPIGTFTKVGLGIQQLVLHDVVRVSKSLFHRGSVTSKNFSQFDIVLDFGIGRNWIISDRVLLGFQVETGLTPASLARIFGLADLDKYLNEEFNNIYSSSTIASRFNFTNELLKISLNIGFLAF